MSSETVRALRKVPEAFRRDGMNFRLVKRTDRVAMVASGEKVFEVFSVRTHKKATYIQNKPVNVPGDEIMPADEDFGKNAWTYPTREAAEAKYAELVAKFAKEVAK